MKNTLQYEMKSGTDQHHSLTQISALRKQVWPDFIRIPDEIIFKLYAIYPDFQVSISSPDTDELIGIANSIPLIWHESLSRLSDNGLSWVMNEGIHLRKSSDGANMLCAISITVAENYRNKGISKMLLRHLKRISENKKYTHLIVPVRPSLKSAYPLIPMIKYIEWKNKDGLPFDPWLRTHTSLGAQIIKVCERSACITSSIEQWERWTKVPFPGDGNYVINDALSPVKIEFDNNTGTYIEPNVWVSYPINHTGEVQCE
ncbi:hypothetical protein FOLKNPGA_03390 [Legionella sp. PC1000]|uniref:GNAT family N-acetyltransferase n=1 Tax=Legionella sp. PC1000 TaxID=2746060 RepID=UPI0015FCD41C|nr:GNAT family N-acetyltransferase [Legionella sp. PC1000]QLZ70576.1 hypothetical protein FOLKNPGA_03390 [Legionella sp. PC1000]